MRVTGWLHQMDEQPKGDLTAEVAALGLDRLCVKALDGASWMSQFDRGNGAIGSVEALKSLEARLEAVSVGLDAWVNVTRADLEKAAPIWGELLAAIKGRLFLDLEPYPRFWGDDGDVGTVAAAISRFDRERLGVTFDPRRCGWVGLDRVMERVSVVSPQVYEFDWLTGTESLVGRWGSDGSNSISERPSWEPLVSVSESVGEWLGIVTSERMKASAFGVWLLPIVDGAQRELLEVMSGGGPKGGAPWAPMADADFRSWAPRTGSWREAAVNLKGIADDALTTGRKMRDGVAAAAALWGTR